jgi:subtilase family serine protease
MPSFRTTSLFVSVALICLLSAPFAFAAANSAAGCTPMAVNRITGVIDESIRTPLLGNIHPLARAEFDKGKVSDNFPLQHIILLLQRTPEQEKALQTRIDQMHNRQSPLFQQWLSADEVGSCFGTADADVAVLSSWLQKHGFTVDAVPAGKTMLIFTGTAGQVQEAFHTEIHHLNVHGEKHIANMSAPEVPAALAPVIAGFRSLHDFMPKPMMHMVGVAKRDPKTGKLYRVKGSENLPSASNVATAKKSGTLITYQGDPFCGDSSCEWVGPQDFYTIYNENPLLTSTSCNGGPCNGAGQTIAVIEETDVCAGQSGTSPNDCAGANDLAMFRSQFGLPAPHAKYYFGIPGYCADPGVQGPSGTGEESEADIDIQWASTTAPGAQVDFLACATTSTTAGVDLASIYAVDHLYRTISSFSLSYGVCEMGLTDGAYGGLYQTNAFYNSLWQQAVAEGQTVNVSAGDSGDDTCDRGLEGAVSGWNVNGLASTPYDVAAGGTDFSDNYSSAFAPAPNTYWNANDTSPYGSALSYVPEMTWNQSCGSTLLASFLSWELGVSYTPEQVCSGDTPFGFDFTYVNGAGSGGISSIYKLPTWQSVYGVGRNFTSSTMRNLPDVSLFASANFWSHALQFCESDALTGTGGGTPCDYTNQDEGGIMAAGGTSFVAPQINGVIAVINQRWQSRQGQANYKLYFLAGQEYGLPTRPNTKTSEPSLLTCESNYLSISEFGPESSACVFHDIYRTPAITTASCAGTNNSSCVIDGNEMPCVTGSTDCFTSNPSDPFGLLSISTSSFEPAWYQAAGFSDATGLGSLNINNLVRAWSFFGPTSASTTTVSADSVTASADNGKTITFTATVTATGRGSFAPPMGTVDFYTAGSSSGSLDCRNVEHLNRLSSTPLVPASCANGCHATAVLSGVTATQLGGSGAHDVIACFSGDAANDAPSSSTMTVNAD